MSGTRATRAAVVGAGHSPVYRYDDVPLGLLAIDAVRQAIADAGLAPSDVTGIVADPEQPFGGAGAVDGVHKVTPEHLIQALGLDVSWHQSIAYGAIATTMIAAVNAVSSGHCDTVVVYRALHNPRGRYGVTSPTHAAGIDQFADPYGVFPPGKFAQLWQRYMYKYGTTREQMAPYVVHTHRNGRLYEHSYWRQHRPEPLTVEEYLEARMISAPVGLYDCDLPVQSAAAFIVTTAERAKDLRHPPAYIRGWAQPGRVGGWGDFSTLEVVQERARAFAQRLLSTAGVGPADIDVANVYDGFSLFVPLWLEAFGFCGEGEAFELMKPESIAIDSGKMALNTSGGSLGAGRMHGVPHVWDSVMQVTGRAGPRQVRRAEVSLCTAGAQPGLIPGLIFSSVPD